MLPDHIYQKIQDEFESEIVSQQSVYGGDINDAAKINLNEGSTFFVKWNSSAPDKMFETEAKGLNLLRS
ncbi:MAG: fructosamine kinase family protein, partial [Balneolaceae bacterium]